VATFKSADAYSQFAREVRTTDRHIRDANALEFLATLLAQAVRDRRRTIPKERILWRAQLGNDWEPIWEGEKCTNDCHRSGPGYLNSFPRFISGFRVG
jgi:hypothetical protein